MNKVDELYTPRLVRTRDLVVHSGILKTILDDAADPRVLERFLIEYCSLGVQITEPVEDWIERAGRRCLEIELPEVGNALVSHASHESGHHLMFMDDTRKLVAHWNGRYADDLDAERLFARPPTQAMQHYVALHEETIHGPLPFGQVAVELEIERLSVVLVPRLIAQVERRLGKEVTSSLTFLSSHGELDVGHTRLNTRMMQTLLELRPDAVGDLARIGAEAMFVYMAFFEECWDMALQACRDRTRSAAE
ncbi:MAG TPA: hypothetical protein VK762_23305 [Polyangiaceae bacterium]|jgi:hypothetical protein|nr:hypothetical protein [Polyangiaceae bacterium]